MLRNTGFYGLKDFSFLGNCLSTRCDYKVTRFNKPVSDQMTTVFAQRFKRPDNHNSTKLLGNFCRICIVYHLQSLVRDFKMYLTFDNSQAEDQSNRAGPLGVLNTALRGRNSRNVLGSGRITRMTVTPPTRMCKL